MITKWGVKNFKSILEADLDLAPLTIFTGVNSSGKSSFLHSIAMLKQSVIHYPEHDRLDKDEVDDEYDEDEVHEADELYDGDEVDDEGDNETLYGSFNLNGDVKLGFMDSVLCYKAADYPDNDIGINFTVILEDNNHVNVKVECGYQEVVNLKRILLIKFLCLEYNNGENTIYIKSQVISEDIFEHKITFKSKGIEEKYTAISSYDFITDGSDQPKPDFNNFNFLPDAIIYSKNSSFEQLNKILRKLNKYFLLNIKYLQPLREEPNWVIDKIQDKNDKQDVDAKGKNTIAFLKSKLEDNYEVENYISPKVIDSSSYSHKSKEYLRNALKDWLIHFGVCTDYEIENAYFDLNRDGLDIDWELTPFYDPDDLNDPSFTRKEGISLYLTIDGKKFTLKQLGTGVGQIFPVLVMCLTAPIGSTIIIQEQEQGLHPKMQSRLADFFIAMALSGRQCIIETHSEYIIEQLRYRIIMMSDLKPEPLHKLTKLYFVTKRNGISHFKDIEINEYARLDEWPENFFDISHKISNKIMKEVIKKWETAKQND